MHNRMQPAIGC